MIRRLLAVARMTLVEAVRSRLLLAIGLVHGAGTAYASLVAALSLGQEARVVAEVSLASFSTVALALVVAQASTSVDLDITRKAVLTVLTRALHRGEWIVGKYLGILAALFLFGASGAALSVAVIGIVAGTSSRVVLTAGVMVPTALVIALPRINALARFTGLVPFAALGVLVALNHNADGAFFARGAALALIEASLVAAVALLFSTFSGPVPTALFTVGVVLVGRSADTLAKLPPRTFPEAVVAFGRALSRVVPNLHIYVPPRSVLAGFDPHVAPSWLLVQGATYAAAWCVVLLAGAMLVTDRRDLG